MSEEAELQQAAAETTPDNSAQQTGTEPEITNADTAEQAKANDDEEHRVPKGVQKRIDRLTQEKYRLRAELDVLRSQQQPQQAPQAQQAAQPSEAPKLEQYQSIEEYLDALTDFKASQKIDRIASEREAKENQTRQQQDAAKLHDGYVKQTEQARQRAPDGATSGAIRGSTIRVLGNIFRRPR